MEQNYNAKPLKQRTKSQIKKKRKIVRANTSTQDKEKTRKPERYRTSGQKTH